jgi:hypothetical protein
MNAALKMVRQLAPASINDEPARLLGMHLAWEPSADVSPAQCIEDAHGLLLTGLRTLNGPESDRLSDAGFAALNTLALAESSLGLAGRKLRDEAPASVVAERLAYLRGLLHSLSDEQRAKIEQAHGLNEEGIRTIDTDSEFWELVEEVDNDLFYASNESTYSHAFGIMHCLGSDSDSDELKARLIEKHGFNDKNIPDPVDRLNSLFAEVQSIMLLRGVEARETAAAAPGPKDRRELSFTRTSDDGRIHSNWYVLRDPNSYHGDGVLIGERYFGEVLQLAACDPVAALHAILYAPQAVEWGNGSGQEHGFMTCLARYAMAAALAFPAGIPSEVDAARMEHEAWERECEESTKKQRDANGRRRARRAAANKKGQAA